MTSKNIIYLLLITFAAALINGCVSQPCLDNTVSAVNVTFYKTGGLAFTADSVTLYGLDRDTSKIYDKATKLAKISFPLDLSADSCSYFLKVNNVADTITLYYNSYPHLVTKECGFTYFSVLEDSINHKVDSIDYQVRNKYVTTANEENIRIFY